jgi:hypothetical protein
VRPTRLKLIDSTVGSRFFIIDRPFRLRDPVPHSYSSDIVLSSRHQDGNPTSNQVETTRILCPGGNLISRHANPISRDANLKNNQGTSRQPSCVLWQLKTPDGGRLVIRCCCCWTVAAKRGCMGMQGRQPVSLVIVHIPVRGEWTLNENKTNKQWV